MNKKSTSSPLAGGGGKNHIYLIDSKTGEQKEIFEDIDGLHFNISGNNNIVKIFTPIGKFVNSTIFIEKTNNAEIIFDESIYLINCFFSIYNGENQKCFIGKYTSFAGNALINIHNNSSLYIGEDCMFSNNIDIWCSDGHTMYDIESGRVLNYPPQCLRIGKHCWIGFGAKLLKNAGLMDNSVLGAFSVLTKNITESNVVVSGFPAKIVKQNIGWTRQSIVEYEKTLPPQDDNPPKKLNRRTVIKEFFKSLFRKSKKRRA